MEKISVIVPVYQAERYLHRCLDSILSQTYTNLQVILVNDGSKDQSGAICDDYARRDNRVMVIHKQNAGVAAARNTGLDVATGQYITFVDSDDYIDSEMYEKMMNKAIAYDCDLVMCDCLKENGETSSLYTHNIRSGFYNYEQLKVEYYSHLLIMENMEYPATISNWVCLFRRQLSSNKPLPRYLEGVRYSEDLLFGAQLMYASRSFYYMKEEAYYHYCMNPTSATHTYVPNKWDDFYKLYHEIYRFFSNSEEYNFDKQIDRCLLFFLYHICGDIYSAPDLTIHEKAAKIKSILTGKEITEMLKRVEIFRLPVSKKLQLITWCYRYRFGIYALVLYYEK